MKPRTAMEPSERQARSRLAQLAHEGDVLRGCLTLLRHACGTPGCHCAGGDKHESWYLAFSQEGRKRMVSIPREALDRGREWVDRYQEARGLLDALSERALGRLLEGRRRRK